MLQHLGSAILQSGNLTLRPFVTDDAEEMFRNWAHDPEVTRYLTWQAHPDSGETRRILDLWVPRYIEADFYNWGIVYEPEAALIGSISFADSADKSGRAEVGYCIGQPWWGKGIMTEALKMVISFAFAQVGLQRIQAIHNVKNPASGRVMQKAGMQLEGIMRRYMLDNEGDYADHALYAILSDHTNT